MRIAAVAGTFDTKGAELEFLARVLRENGVPTRTIDVGTSGTPSNADVGAFEIATCHPDGAEAVLGISDRGKAVARMAVAFKRYVAGVDWIGGMLGAGGSGGTALLAPAMQCLSVGIPKLLVSTVASGNVASYVGTTDIAMMYSVTDIQGLNRISRKVLGNAASALAGMMRQAETASDIEGRALVGLTMFGVTTTCVAHVSRCLEKTLEPIVFHATGTGGRSMEKLVDSGLISAVMDLTTTEIADLIVGGVMPATPDRLGAIIRTGVPYVGSCGALDMVNFGTESSVPERFRGRQFHLHNPQVTLMRTTPEENRAFGEWIAVRLNRMPGPVRFLIPQGGVSALDAPGEPFHDPEADAALFGAIEERFRDTSQHRLLRVEANLNSTAFADAALEAFREVSGEDLGTH